MRRIGILAVTLALLLGLLAFRVVAAEQNYCAQFEEGITELAALQTEDVTDGGAFADAAVLLYTLRQMTDVQQYESEQDNGVYLLPQEMFEAEARRRFDVEISRLRSLKQEGRAVYDANDEIYTIADYTPPKQERYIIRGYQKRGEIYTAYYTQVEETHERSVVGAVEGKDYVLDYRSASAVPLKLTDKHLKVTFTYAGGIRRFRTWTHLRELPSLQGMTTHTKSEGTVISTQKTTPKTDKTTGASTSVQTADTTARTEAEKTIPKEENITTTSRTTIKNGRVTGIGDGSTALRTTIPTEPMEVLFRQDGVLIQAPAATFPKEIVLSAVLLQGVADGVAQQALKDRAVRMRVYDLFATKSGKQLQPSGRVNVTFSIPDGYEPSRTAIVYIAAGGTAEILVSKVDAAAGTVSADLDKLGTVVVAELRTANRASGPDVVLIVSGLLVLAAAVAAVWYLRRKQQMHVKQPADADME